jgi:ABC-2 type transport system permease protein
VAEPSTLTAYRALVAAQWRAQTQYRVSFALDVTVSGLVNLLDVLVVLVLFRLTPALGGFDVRTALLMASIAGCGFALADLTVGNIERLSQRIRTGALDALFARPLPVLAQLVVGDVGFRRIGKAVQGVGMLVAALIYAHPPLPPERVLLLVGTVAAAVIFNSGIFIAASSVSFWWVDSGEFSAAFTYGGRDFTLYPVTVYGGLLRRVFAFGLGFAFVAYYPTLALLGRADPLGLPSWVGRCSPLVAVAVLAVAMLIWRTGVRHYRSTGS